jgi:hypothetical protein
MTQEFFINPNSNLNPFQLKKERKPYWFFMPGSSIVSFPDNGLPNILANMNLGDTVNKNNVYYTDKYSNTVIRTNYLNQSPSIVGDYSIFMTNNDTIEYAEYIAASNSKIYVLGTQGTLLSRNISTYNTTTWNIAFVDIFNVLAIIALNDGGFFIVRNNNDGTMIIEDWSTGSLSNTIILAGYLIVSKKDYTGNILSILTYDQTNSSLFYAYILDYTNNTLTLKYTWNLPTPAPYDTSGYDTDPIDLSFTQYVIDNTIHDMLYVFQSDHSINFFFRTIDLTAQTENVSIANSNQYIELSLENNRQFAVYATAGIRETFGLDLIISAPYHGGGE